MRRLISGPVRTSEFSSATCREPTPAPDYPWSHKSGVERTISIMEGCAMERPPEAAKSFEEIYPQYPFAELVRLSIALGKRLRHSLDVVAWKGHVANPGAKPRRPGPWLQVGCSARCGPKPQI